MIIFVFILLIIIIFAGIFRNKILKIIYPKKYEEVVLIYSEKYKVDENLVFAVIKAESGFKPKAISSRNAIGLMQIMEETAIDVAKKYDIKIDSNNAKDGNITIDKTGKLSGRGAYICDSIECLEKVIKNKRLEKVLEKNISEEIYNELRGVIIDKAN